MFMQTLAPNELAANVGEQEKIDAILKAFHRLPGQELERLQIDLTKPVIAGTPEAEALFVAWTLRQAELKEAMKNILKPAEFMTNITRTLNGTAAPGVQAIVLQTASADGTTESGTERETASPAQLSIEDKVYLLGQLESLLDDVDNARDFHTIGAWPTLLSFLRPEQPLPVRAVAAWAVGTAVKNTYDYQLWTLEGWEIPTTATTAMEGSTVSSFVSCLDLLVQALGSAPTATNEQYELQKRALYALSSAMRGNMDVQNALLGMPIPSADGTSVEVRYVHYLHLLATQHAQTPVELVRKVWAAAADLLEERAYIRGELEREVKLIQAALANVNTNTTGSATNSPNDAASVQAQVDTARALQEAVLLGDHLTTAEWLQVGAEVADKYATALGEVEAQIRAMAANPEAPEPTMSNSEQVAMHATLRSVFSFARAALVDSPQLHASTTTTTATTTTTNLSDAVSWQHRLQLAVRKVLEIGANDKEGAYESLMGSAEELGALLGLLDQGANSAVF